ncbi:MAG: CopG family transcriptional regulator [Steroidobacteraceae bacterium]|jgi:predicted DNA-binding protein
MAQRKKARGRAAAEAPRSIRASVSLKPETYRTLEALARQKKVSTAWVLRDAAEKYIAEQWPLFAATASPTERGGSR